MKSVATAVAYYRTSSTNPKDADSDSRPRQRDACMTYAKASGLEIVREFYDAGVSGTDPIHDRPAFVAMIEYMLGNGARIILVESPSRFARDLTVQLTGFDWLKAKEITLIPVDMPDMFTNDSPTATLIRQILGAVAEFQKAEVVAKLHRGRRKKIGETGWAGGQPRVPAEVVALARRLSRKDSNGKRRSLRAIGDALAKRGFIGVSGKPLRTRERETNACEANSLLPVITSLSLSRVRSAPRRRNGHVLCERTGCTRQPSRRRTSRGLTASH